MTEENPSVEEWWAGMIDDLIWRSIEEDEHLSWYNQISAGFLKKEEIAGVDLEKVMEKLRPIIEQHIHKIAGDFEGMLKYGWMNLSLLKKD